MIRALTFNGADTHISLGDFAVEQRLPGAFSVEAWVRRDIRQEWTAFAGILEDDGVREKGWALGLAWGRPAFGLATESGKKMVWAKAKQDYCDGRWRHVAGVYDGSGMKLYVDAVLEGASENSGAVLYPEKGEFVIGAFKDSNEFYPFSGHIAEVRLWKTALSRDALAVRKDYRLDPKDHSDLIGYWPMIDGAGRVIQNWAESGQNGRAQGGVRWEDRGGLTLSGHVPDPSPPSRLTAEDIKDDRFTAKWEPVSGVKTYILDVAADSEFKTPVKGFAGFETAGISAAVTGLESQTRYFWRVSGKTPEKTGRPGGVKETETRMFAIPDGNWAVSFPEDGTHSTFIDFGKIEDAKDALPKEAFTVEAWVRPENFDDAGISGVIGKDGEEQKGWLLGIKEKRFCFSVSGKDTDGAGEAGIMTDLVSKKGFEGKKWRHVAGVYSGKEMELYVDGDRICGSKKAAGALSYPADEKGDFFAGRAVFSKEARSFQGMMGDIRLWKGALSEGEIRKQMEFRIEDPAREKNLLAWWPLCKGSGSDIADARGNLHGRLSGRAEWADAKDLCLFWPLEDAVQAAAGLRHALALKKDGSVWAWGTGGRGQLGDGAYKHRVFPTPVKDAQGVKYLARIRAVAAGYFHSAALDEEGRVWSWGDHSLGQLGNEELKKASGSLPVRVALTGVKSISTLVDFTLALKNDGTVWAWGANDKGQLGNDPASAGGQSAAPLQVKADNSYSHLEDIVQIAAGRHHGLALEKNGRVWAWGDNEKEQTGDKTRMALYAPTRIKDEKNERLSGVKKVWAGHDHGMARTDEKTLIWGRNNDNQLGDKTGKDRPVPGPVRGGDGGEVTPLDIAVGKSHAVSVLEDSTVFAWGRGVVGGLGMETFGAESDFVQVQSCFALRKDGSVWAWGYNKEGQVGDNGAPNHRPVPVPVHGVDDVGELKDVRWISGYSSRYAVLNDGRVCVWGWNGNNETGTNTRTTSRRHIPYPIYLRKDDQHVFEEKVAKVKAGPLTSYAITEDGALWGWGHIDGKHVLGLGYNVTDFYPKKVMEKGVADVAARDRGGLAVKDDGSLWIWGHNSYGLLGQGHFNATTFDTPKQMNGLPSMIAAAAGAYYTLALDGEGFVWAWGDNRYGQLGINSTADKQATPAKVAMDASGNPLENVVAISATGNNGMALTSDGFVWTWGQNQYGCLGYAAAGNANQRTARRVEMSSEESRFLFGVQGIACGGAVSFALGDDGIVRAWGYGKEGQRGDGTKTETKTYPVETLLPKTKDQANKENPT